MLPGVVWVLTLVLTGVFAIPATFNEDYPVVTEKRAALVLDRLFVALQNALRNEEKIGKLNTRRMNTEPQYAPLKTAPLNMDSMNAPQRRDQDKPKGRLTACFFNPITCIF